MRIYKDLKTGIYHADYSDEQGRHRPSLHTRNIDVATLKAADLIKSTEDETFPNCPFQNFENRYFNYIKVFQKPNTVGRAEYACFEETIKEDLL